MFGENCNNPKPLIGATYLGIDFVVMATAMTMIIQAARCDSRALHQEQAAEQPQCHPWRGLLHNNVHDKVDNDSDGVGNGDMRI